MKAVIQRVKYASVTVDGEQIGSCSHGLMVLLGVAEGDTPHDAELMAKKIVNLRIFCDDAGKMNLSLKDVDGEMLVISQFTLLANYRNGNRPDYLASAKPETANELYEYFIRLVSADLRRVEHGKFGADMKVELLNDGPVTIVMDSEVLKSKK